MTIKISLETFVTLADEFHALPQDARNAVLHEVLGGQPSLIQLDPDMIDTGRRWIFEHWGRTPAYRALTGYLVSINYLD